MNVIKELKIMLLMKIIKNDVPDIKNKGIFVKYIFNKQ